MLHYKTIDNKTLDLLRQLLSVPEFSKLRLVGGTSLALQIGHRKSVDIDLFGNIDADEFTIAEQLMKIGQTTRLQKSENINIYLINKIKVDIVNYPYKWLEEAVIEDGLVLADKQDIAAMKLSAITGRGSKKDFIDLFFLLKEFPLEKLLSLYTGKYPDGSKFLVLKSLSYFIDADENEMPIMINPIHWDHIKKLITSSVESYVKN